MDPSDQRTMFKMANFCDANYQSDKSEDLYLKSIDDEIPSCNRICTYADFLLTARKNPNAAIVFYETCLHLSPNHGEAAHNLALVLSKRDPKRAADLFEISLKNCAKDSLSYVKCLRNASHFFEVQGGGICCFLFLIFFIFRAL
jgi:hypothetical protein